MIKDVTTSTPASIVVLIAALNVQEEIGPLAFTEENNTIWGGGVKGRIIKLDVEERKITDSFLAHEDEVTNIATSKNRAWTTSQDKVKK